MPAITDGEIRELASFKGSMAPVTSLYLDVDGRRRVRHTDVVHQLELMLRDARGKSDGNPSVLDDFRRIAEFVKGGLDRSRMRGLAIFSCSVESFWRVVQLPVPVRDQLVVNHTPSVRQLELVIDEYERFGVLLADRQRARMFVFELGELVESEDHFDQLPRGDDHDHSYTKDQARGHATAVASQHLRNAAALAWRVYQAQEFDRLIIGAPTEIATELESLLHPYLRDRVEAQCSIPVGASDDEIRSAALQVEADVERRAEADAVERLRDAAGSGRRGVVGLDATLDALAQRRLDTLFVSSGYSAPGWRCGACDHVARVGRTCPVCRSAMHPIDDVVEEIMEVAIGQSCRVEVCVDNADLDVLGRIGALLRY